ncbi:MAG TPA: HAMP domain-containing protein [Gemmatimonadales bacterium]|nr:HAMP domain-containing protein [Gemmatimonadales bacterium]
MQPSRLRLRLAGSFALAFLVGLGALNVALVLYLGRQSELRLQREARAIGSEVIDAVRRELDDRPGRPLASAAPAALREWPAGPEAIVVYSDAGAPIAQFGDTSLTRPDFLVTTLSATGAPPFAVAVLLPRAPVQGEMNALERWLAVSTPLVLLLSLIGGYHLARRSLAPIGALGAAIGSIAPDALHQRVPIVPPPDEIGRLGEQFNHLLERLQRAQAQNRQFLRRAAHQIRTPLTLVLGEADLSLERPRTVEEQWRTLTRVRLAAQQMKRRVDELLLLAHAEAGDCPPLDEAVELDGLVLECADLMRGRAQALRRHLELGRVDALTVRGSAALLREALLELIENACRHGSETVPIRISAYVDGDATCLVVESGGPPPPLPTPEANGGREFDAHGLGLVIVRWIAGQHGGQLVHTHRAGVNSYAARLPAPMASDDRGLPPAASQPPSARDRPVVLSG